MLDVEWIRPGGRGGEGGAALTGSDAPIIWPALFDGVPVDAGYATGPFLKAVERLGWGVVAGLKQERYEIYQEAPALMDQSPPLDWKWEDRQIQLREVKDLPITDPAIGLLRVVQANERWSENRREGGRKRRVAQHRFGRWLVSPKPGPYPAQTIWQLGHARWGIENHGFNELTQHYHLEHCPHHEPVAILAWLLILTLAFNLFEWFVRLHGKRWQAAAIALAEAARQLDRALEQRQELEPHWSGCAQPADA